MHRCRSWWTSGRIPGVGRSRTSGGRRWRSGCRPPACGIAGRRRSTGRSPNVALRHPSFRSYADHMAASAFREALTRVADDASERVVAVMCAESVWWRCHRRLIADAAVLLHGVDVRHLFHDGRLTEHRPSPEARIVDLDGRPTLVYDVGADVPLFDGPDAPAANAG